MPWELLVHIYTPLILPNSLSKSLIQTIRAQLIQQQMARTMDSASHGVTFELTGLLPGMYTRESETSVCVVGEGVAREGIAVVFIATRTSTL